ncbi:MAG: HEPN domain-containing protein [Nanoarchaeota archaeon]
MNSEDKSSELWEEIVYDKNLVHNAMELAKRDLKTSMNMFDDADFDWSYAISYNAMLQAGRALMFSQGKRPKGKYKHVSVVEFVKKNFGQSFADKLLFMFNKIRKKRHTVVYEQINVISKEEARLASEIAQEFVSRVAELISV